MSETVSLDALGVLLRRLQVDVRAMSVKLDLLTRGRERDLTPSPPATISRSPTNWRTSICGSAARWGSLPSR